MRKQLAALVIAGTALAGVVVAPGAQAAPTGTTSTSFELTGGALGVTVPASATLTGAATNVLAQAITGSLGTTTVTDARGALVAAWTTSVSSTDFVTGTAPREAAQIVPSTEVDYTTGLATATSGVITATPGLVTQDLSAARTAMVGAGVGNNSVSWAPSLTVNVPAGNVAGTYSGTITHSVA